MIAGIVVWVIHHSHVQAGNYHKPPRLGDSCYDYASIKTGVQYITE